MTNPNLLMALLGSLPQQNDRVVVAAPTDMNGGVQQVLPPTLKYDPAASSQALVNASVPSTSGTSPTAGTAAPTSMASGQTPASSAPATLMKSPAQGPNTTSSGSTLTLRNILHSLIGTSFGLGG